MAEKMITLGKKNTEASKRQALAYLFVGVDRCLGGSSVLTVMIRDRKKCSPNSSAHCVNVTPTVPEDTRACYV